MRTLLVLWGAWRLARKIVAIAVIAMLGMFVLGGGLLTARSQRSAVARLRHVASPLEEQLKHGVDHVIQP